MMTLRWKLSWQIAALIVSLVLIGTAALWGLNGLNQNFGAALDGYQRLRKIYEVGAHVQTARVLMSVSQPEPAKARSELQRAQALFDLDFRENEAGEDHDLQQAERAALTTAIGSGDSPDELDASAITRVLGPLVAMDVRNSHRIEAAENQARDKRQLTMYWMAGLCLAVATFALLIGIAQYRSVMAPLRSLKAAAQRVATGRFEQRVPETGSLEFAELARSFNRMAGELHGLYRDLQQKVDAKSKELVRNERLASVGFLAAGVAHEINNPLGIITASAELSMESIKPGKQLSADELKQSLAVICEEAFRCKQIVEKLLSLATAPRKPEENFSLEELSRETVKTVAALPEYRQRKLTVAATAAGNVRARRGEIKQVILNLLFNAMQATGAGGEVTVEITPGAAVVELAVGDNGRGMSGEILDRVFEPFYTDPRGKSAPSEDERRGTGLGLSITHAIVRRYGGEIRAESAGADKGSRFIVTLPVATEAAA